MGRLRYSHPCDLCGLPCDRQAVHCRPYSRKLRTTGRPQLQPRPNPYKDQEPQTRVHVIYEVYCLACGRGTGPSGVLVASMAAPQQRLEPCSACGGFMLVREVVRDRWLATVAVSPRGQGNVRKVA